MRARRRKNTMICGAALAAALMMCLAPAIGGAEADAASIAERSGRTAMARRYTAARGSVGQGTSATAWPPMPYSVTNSASYEESGVNGHGIAQGSIFIVFGYDLGPETLVQAGAYPLPLALGGTAITVSVGGVTAAVPILYTSSQQVAALLPSTFPLGTGTLKLTRDGVAAQYPLSINVVKSSFGTYSISGNGTGAGSITSADYRLKTYKDPARVGETLILWGTGLGPVDGNEAAGPLPGNRFSDVDVFVGGVRAQVDYAGRSGCCAGLDQIAFRVPATTYGCFVPVAVRYGGVTANFVTIPVADTGQACREAVGVSSELLEKASTGAEVRVGGIVMGPIPVLQSAGFSFYGAVASQLSALIGVNVSERTVRMLANSNGTQRTSFMKSAIRKYGPLLAAKGIGAGEIARLASGLKNQGIAARFGRVKGLSSVVSLLGAAAPPPGTCTLVKDWSFDPNQWGATGSGEDAGASLSLAGPLGAGTLSRVAKGEYQLPFGPAVGLGQFPIGTYEISAPGGTSVGAFRATLKVSGIEWTNKSAVTYVDRKQPLRITWVGMPEPGASVPGYVLFGGASSASDAKYAFACVAPASAGELTVPEYILSALPRSTTQKGSLFLAAHPLQNSFSATGIDFGYFADLGSDSKEVEFR